MKIRESLLEIRRALVSAVLSALAAAVSPPYTVLEWLEHDQYRSECRTSIRTPSGEELLVEVPVLAGDDEGDVAVRAVTKARRVIADYELSLT